MSTRMNRLFGNNVVKIEAPQDRSELRFVVLDDEGDFNSDNSPITIDFSDLLIGMLFDPDTE